MYTLTLLDWVIPQNDGTFWVTVNDIIDSEEFACISKNISDICDWSDERFLERMFSDWNYCRYQKKFFTVFSGSPFQSHKEPESYSILIGYFNEK